MLAGRRKSFPLLPLYHTLCSLCWSPDKQTTTAFHLLFLLIGPQPQGPFSATNLSLDMAKRHSSMDVVRQRGMRLLKGYVLVMIVALLVDQGEMLLGAHSSHSNNCSVAMAQVPTPTPSVASPSASLGLPTFPPSAQPSAMREYI